MKGIGTVQTKYGLVQGVVRDGITCFRGIPYAAPPVGERRWKAPEEPESWEGVRVCDTFSDIAWQPPGFVGDQALKTNRQNEDCLYLNIWTPAQSAGEKLPVLFWIHGGGFAGGLGHEELYHGWHFAEKGVVVVSINYRLGVFGFLAHPALSKESPHGVSGNYGLLDQIRALEWVKQNIAAFGGDPRRITIDGQSAGGMSVCVLLASPLTHSLFSGAIIQSGGPVTSRAPTLREGEAAGAALQVKLGCDSLAAMRALPPEILLHAESPETETGALRYQPLMDGYVLPQQVFDAFCRDEIAKVPILFGSNADEGLFSPVEGKTREQYLANAKAYFGADFPAFQRLYLSEEKAFARTQTKVGRDFAFARLRFIAGRLEKQHPCPVFHYYFCQPAILEDGTNLGAGHSGELFYVFHTLECLGGSTPDGRHITVRKGKKEYDLSEQMSSYWAAFCKNGDPAVLGLPEWPAYTVERDEHLRFFAEETRAERPREPEKIDLLAAHL